MKLQANYNNVKKYYKVWNQLKSELNRDPMDEEMVAVLGNEDFLIMKNYLIDRDEEKFNLRIKLSVKNDNLIQARLKKGLKQSEVAKELNISTVNYGAIENCRYFPDHNKRKQICNFFEKTENYLFPEWLNIFTEKWKRAENEKLVEMKQESLESQEVKQLIDPYDINSKIDINFLKSAILDALDDLTPREQKIIKYRFGIEDGISHSLEEVAEFFGVTRERIKQIEQKALEKIENSKKLEPFKNLIC